MILADVLKIVFLVIGTMAVFISYWLTAKSLFPTLVSHAHDAYGHRPGRLLLTGVVVSTPLLLVGAGLLNAVPQGGLKLLGALLATVPILMGLLGSAGLSERIGRGLVSADDTHTPWRRSLRGAAVLSTTFLLPIVGWFVVLPLTLISGVGAFVLARRAAAQGKAQGAAPLVLEHTS